MGSGKIGMITDNGPPGIPEIAIKFLVPEK
jgi:hypothetical protein